MKKIKVTSPSTTVLVIATLLLMWLIVSVGCSEQLDQWKQQSQRLTQEGDEIIKNIEANPNNPVPPETVERLSQIQSTVAQLNSKVQGAEDLWDLAQLAVGSAATGTPLSIGLAVLAGLFRKRKRQTVQLVKNIQDAKSGESDKNTLILDANQLRSNNIKHGLEPLIQTIKGISS